MKHYNIPIFVVHYGCSNMCVFCNQEKITGRTNDRIFSEVRNTIEEYLETIPPESDIEVAFFGGSFTAIPQENQIKYLSIVQPYIESGKVRGIRISTRPDCISQEIVDFLLRMNVTTIELGVQSFDDKVLEQSKRGHKVEDVYKASKLIKESGISLGIQVMPGLPGATWENDINAANEIIKINPDIVRIYPTLVISNTEMEEMYRCGSYYPMEIEEAVRRSKYLLSRLELNGINVIRVGLQPSEELREEGIIIAGPFHPAFRELVESEIFFDFLRKFDSDIVIKTNQKSVSRFVGLNKINKKRLKINIKFEIDNKMDTDSYIINKETFTREDILKNTILNASE